MNPDCNWERGLDDPHFDRGPFKKEGRMKNYVVIYFNEDGDAPNVETLTGEQLRDRLREDCWGRNVKFAEPGSDVRGGETGGLLVVIEGNIIKPKIVEVVTEYEL